MNANPPLASLQQDPYLAPYLPHIQQRAQHFTARRQWLTQAAPSLADFANAHEFYGLHRTPKGDWIFREFAPNASAIWLVGDCSQWQRRPEFQLTRADAQGNWLLKCPASALQHGQHYHLQLEWPGGHGTRIPAFARRVVQDPHTHLFCAQVWDPTPYAWKHPSFQVPDRSPLIYEAHIGMAQETESVGTYTQFRTQILPRIAANGYNTLQLMAIMEHPYYGSFGYQVSNFFACSSRFGTPEELQALIDAAHGYGIAVIMDLVHSHAVLNEAEGIARFDGSTYLYFHDGPRGRHPVWDSACFDYGRLSTLHFLLSNCRYWLDTFHFDGFRFDGVTSMLYHHHGIGVNFVHYDQYFDATVDEDAYTYLALANDLIHTLRPDAITIAEDVSGMPGLGATPDQGGAGFNYRLAMGVPETWGQIVRKIADTDLDLSWLWHELTNRRLDEQTISYAESHDQALVGGKTLFFEMTGEAIYHGMQNETPNLTIERAVALHKLIRLATLSTASHGYLNFMGNEFGHPEWIDFPREGNQFSYHYARRQWSLRDDPTLQFHALGEFDCALIQTLAQQQPLLQLPIQLLQLSNEKKTLVFHRQNLLFAFNFHPTQSYPDWEITVPPGDYQLLLNTDDPAFAGQGRIQKHQVFHPTSALQNNEQIHTIRLYLPARTAVILRRIPQK